MFNPSPEQAKIIQEESSCVVIANPGSGKTSTLACKIKNILSGLPEYKGVIAISYTNKASDELKKRSLGDGINKKSSFFGTIDKFYLTEIVLPFGLHVFGNPISELNILKASLELEAENPLQEILNKEYEELDINDIKVFRDFFLAGKVYLEAVGLMSLYVFDNSPACRRYLNARYTHVFIDEYQDSGKEQNQMFLRLQEVGLCAVAVGDLNQSIYAFSGKDSKYLSMLAVDTKLFKTYSLQTNHRCHPSIIEYSMKLLSKTYSPKTYEDIRVLFKYIQGSEIEITQWLNNKIVSMCSYYGIDSLNQVGILVRNGRTAEIVHNHLLISHKVFHNTPLDEDSSLWSGVFRKVLNVIFDKTSTMYEIVEDYLNIDLQQTQAKKIIELLREITSDAKNDPDSLIKSYNKFVDIAKLVYPRCENKNAMGILQNILKDKSLLLSFKPAENNEVQVMTLHKSKGLEFDLVFHLDLYEYILPKYKATYDEWVQDLNLHYVGITRARKCCVLCCSSYRHNKKGKMDAGYSQFLTMNDLNQLRIDSPF